MRALFESLRIVLETIAEGEPAESGRFRRVRQVIESTPSLMAAQMVGAVGITIGIATASLLARDLSGSEKLAGLAQTFQVLGTAVSAFLLARLMSRRGRRVGLVTGYVLGTAGAVLAVVVKAAGPRLNLLGAWLTGSVLAYVAALIVNAMVILRTRTDPLRFSEWAPLLGYPSIIFVVVFGGLGVWLHHTWRREHPAAPQQPKPLSVEA